MNYVPSIARLHLFFFLHQAIDIAWNELKIGFPLSSPYGPPIEDERFNICLFSFHLCHFRGIPHAVHFLDSPQEHTTVRDIIISVPDPQYPQTHIRVAAAIFGSFFLPVQTLLDTTTADTEREANNQHTDKLYIIHQTRYTNRDTTGQILHETPQNRRMQYTWEVWDFTTAEFRLWSSGSCVQVVF
jgi:hypothetical protein